VSDALLFALTVLAVYMVGVSLMTTQVSYPLFAAVGADAFVGYHRRYNGRIPLVVVVPGFVSFLACAAFPLLAPDGVPGWAAGAVAAGGVTALLATVTTAIPAHLALQRVGFDPRTYRRLVTADRVRTLGCAVSAATLVWSSVPAS
jgi:hypothetical protein